MKGVPRLRAGAATLLPVGLVVAVLYAGLGHVPPTESSAEGRASDRSRQANHGAHLTRQLHQLAPRGAYVVVDTAHNRLHIMRGERTIYTAVASTGSGALLRDPHNPERRWKFDTPRGVFHVTSKLTKPVWNRPDWAFIEEGLAIPRDPVERLQGEVLGDYALGFGDRYFIHGTLYTRLLGTNVTHGCIRLGDEDLRQVFTQVPLGATVIIF